MATQFAPYAEPETEEVVEARGLTLADILSGQNLAELLSEQQLNEIGQKVIDDVEIDESSRGEWRTKYDRSLEIAMQVSKPKNFPWPKAANVKLPVLTVAAIQFQAEAYPVIVDGSNLVKGRVLGPDPEGIKRARADRMGQHMTYQLLYGMENWEEETDRLLLMLPIGGTVIRKVFYDELENANCSEIVAAPDFIINYWAKSIEKAPRYTQRLYYYPYEVRDKIAMGQWLPVPLDEEDTEKNSGDDDQGLGEYFEQHRGIDLDGDGRPEHYVVTATTEGKVARISPCFGPENITVMLPGLARPAKLSELMMGLAEIPDLPFQIVKIERRQYFIKYGFIPSPDGSFYDLGFGMLLEGITENSDTLVNQMLDAASLANAGGGFIGSGVNIRGGNMRFALGEFKRIDAPGGPLKDNFMMMPAPGPSPVSFTLLELLLSMAKDITSSQDVVAGRAPANQPATTTLALLEQAQTVRKGIYKRVHRAFGKEVRALRQLNRNYLDEQEYFELVEPEPMLGPEGEPVMGQNGRPMMQETASIGRQDYEDDDLDVIPVTDPSQVSDLQKAAKAEALMERFNGDPLINQKQIRQDYLVAVGAKDIPRYFEVPQPPPPPEMIKIAGELEVKNKDADTRRVTADAQAAEKYMGAAERAVNIGLIPDAAALAAEAVEDVNATADGQADLSGLVGQPGDDGVPGMAGGGGPEALGPMGEGAAFDAGDAGAGGGLPGPVGPGMGQGG